MKKRLKKVIHIMMVLIILGLSYMAFVKIFHIGISCPIYKITHLKCPGCGISRMFLHISTFQFYEAFCDNRVLFILTPVLLCIIMKMTIRYVKEDKFIASKNENIILVILTIIFIIWGIVRNFIKM